MAALILSRPADSEQVLVAVVGPIQVVAILRVPEINLDASGPKNLRIPGRRLAVERANRDFYFLGKLTPIGNAVIAALKDKGISVLHAVRIDTPLVGIERAVEIRAVAGRK